MRVLPMGRLAVIVEDPPGGPAPWSLGVRALAVEGVVDVVPAAATVLIRCDTAAALTAVTERLADVTPVAHPGEGSEVIVPVVYDGDDLEHVARAADCTVEEVIELHSGGEYEVAFCGFAPGFGYLAGLPRRLHLSRRDTPRTRVPAGSVAIASGYSAVYPRESPGGWHLIGRTAMTLFDAGREPPAVLQPGVVVRFERS